MDERLDFLDMHVLQQDMCIRMTKLILINLMPKKEQHCLILI